MVNDHGLESIACRVITNCVFEITGCNIKDCHRDGSKGDTGIKFSTSKISKKVQTIKKVCTNFVWSALNWQGATNYFWSRTSQYSVTVQRVKHHRIGETFNYYISIRSVTIRIKENGRPVTLMISIIGVFI